MDVAAAVVKRSASSEEGDGDCGGDQGVRKRKRWWRFRGPKRWKDGWLDTYPWAAVRVVDGAKRMFCTVCEVHSSTARRNAFRKDGSTNFQASALWAHAESSAHRTALQVQKFSGPRAAANPPAGSRNGAPTNDTLVPRALTEPFGDRVAGKGPAPMGPAPPSGAPEAPAALHHMVHLVYQTVQSNHTLLVEQLHELGERMVALERSVRDLRTQVSRAPEEELLPPGKGGRKNLPESSPAE